MKSTSTLGAGVEQPDDALRALGANLGTLRRVARLTCSELAQRSRVSRGTVENLERGNSVTLRNALQIAAALGVLDRVVGATEPQTPEQYRAAALDSLPRRVRHRRDAQPDPDD